MVELVRFETPDELARVVADRWFDELSARPQQYCAFSGGRIAEKFFDALTACSRGRESAADLNSVHFFWADERCVPADHAESNYRLMHTRLLKPLNIPDSQVHRIKGEMEPSLAA